MESCGRRHAHHAGKRLQPDPDAVHEFCVRGALLEREELKERLGEFVGQKAEAWEDGGPPEVSELDIVQRHGKHVADLRSLHVDRTHEGMNGAEVQRHDILQRGRRRKLPVGSLRHDGLDNAAVRYRNKGRYGGAELVVRLRDGEIRHPFLLVGRCRILNLLAGQGTKGQCQ